MLVLNNYCERFIEISKEDYLKVVDSYDMSSNSYFPLKNGRDILKLNLDDMDKFLEDRRIFYVKNNNNSKKSTLIEFHFFDASVVDNLNNKPYNVPKYVCHYIQKDFLKTIRSLKAKWVKRGKEYVEKGLAVEK